MKRQIKFRALELDTGNWVYGGFVSIDGYAMSNGVPDLNEPVTRYYIFQDGERREVAEETVGQFTGLLDKNGVEIYEGDVVSQHAEWNETVYFPGGYDSSESNQTETVGVIKIYPSKGVVITRAKKTDLLACNGVWVKTSALNARSSRSVVIGNIHNNPELLEK